MKKSEVSLSTEELARYNRQIIYPDFGEEGQIRLKRAHVLIAGVGGLGSPNATNLAYAGIGRLTLVDCGAVELSNLNRQTLHWERDIDEAKVVSAAAKLREMNTGVEVTPLDVKITAENAGELLEGVDLVMDCMDNMATRFILNEWCYKKGIACIFAGIHGLEGQVTTIIPGKTPCLECLYPRGIEGKTPVSRFRSDPGVDCSPPDDGGDKAPFRVRGTPDRENALRERGHHGVHDCKNRKEEELPNLWRGNRLTAGETPPEPR